MNLIGLFFVAAGAFSIAGAVFNWNWFMKERLIVRVLTRDGARIFCGIVGLTVVVLGILITIGIVNMNN